MDGDDGVLHGYDVAEYGIICRDGARGTLNPLCLVAASDNRAARELAQSSWMAKMFHILQLSAELEIEAEPGLTLPTLLGSC